MKRQYTEYGFMIFLLSLDINELIIINNESPEIKKNVKTEYGLIPQLIYLFANRYMIIITVITFNILYKRSFININLGIT